MGKWSNHSVPCSLVSHIVPWLAMQPLLPGSLINSHASYCLATLGGAPVTTFETSSPRTHLFGKSKPQNIHTHKQLSASTYV